MAINAGIAAAPDAPEVPASESRRTRPASEALPGFVTRWRRTRGKQGAHQATDHDPARCGCSGSLPKPRPGLADAAQCRAAPRCVRSLGAGRASFYWRCGQGPPTSDRLHHSPRVGRVLPAGARRRTRRNIGLRTGTPPEKTAWRHSREHPAPGLHPCQEVARPPVSISHHSLKNNPQCDTWGRCIPVLAEYAPLVIYRTDCAPRTRPHGAAALGHRAFSSGAARTAPASVPEVAS